MTNIWKDTFEEIRKPHFTIEDPYTLREKREKEEKEGKQKRWWDDDGDGVGYEPGEVSGKFKKKKKVKESVENIFEVDKTKSANEKIDIMKGGKRNKVTINPPMKEEVEEWVNELVEEGHDLSQFTWDEMAEIYETAELEEQMPARGDAETVNATDQKTLSAKRRLAQAQIRADLARVQLQKSSMPKNESFDAIVEYLSGRKKVFETIEVEVFRDIKKNK